MTRRDPRRLAELQLHTCVVDLLRASAALGVIWYHVPNGELRAPAVAAKLQRMGVLPGVSDITLLLPRLFWWPQPAFLELKGNGGRLSPAQQDFINKANAHNCWVAVADTPEAAFEILVKWRAVLLTNGRLVSHGKARSTVTA